MFGYIINKILGTGLSRLRIRSFVRRGKDVVGMIAGVQLPRTVRGSACDLAGRYNSGQCLREKYDVRFQNRNFWKNAELWDSRIFG